MQSCRLAFMVNACYNLAKGDDIMKKTIIALASAVLGMSLLCGCSAEDLQGLDLTKISDFLQDHTVIVNIDGQDIRVDDTDALLDAIGRGDAVSEQGPAQMPDDRMEALIDAMREAGAPEGQLAQMQEAAASGRKIPFPGMNIVKKIWEKNGITVDGMHEAYDQMVARAESLGINIDIASFDTGFGTVEELCEIILGDIGSIPGLAERAIDSLTD